MSHFHGSKTVFQNNILSSPVVNPQGESQCRDPDGFRPVHSFHITATTELSSSSWVLFSFTACSSMYVCVWSLCVCMFVCVCGHLRQALTCVGHIKVKGERVREWEHQSHQLLSDISLPFIHLCLLFCCHFGLCLTGLIRFTSELWLFFLSCWCLACLNCQLLSPQVSQSYLAFVYLWTHINTQKNTSIHIQLRQAQVWTTARGNLTTYFAWGAADVCG